MDQRAAALSATLIRALLIALLLLGLAACGGDDGGGGGEGSPEAAADFKRHEIKDHGIAIGLPSDWKTVSPGEVLSDQEMEDLSSENPSIAPYLESVSGPNSPIKFFAFDPDVQKGFATNLNIIVAGGAGGADVDDLAKAAVSEIEKLPTVTTDITEDRVDLDAGEAVRLRFEQKFQSEGTTIDVATTQYGLVEGGTSYILSFTTLPEQLKAYEDDFASSMQTFKISG